MVVRPHFSPKFTRNGLLWHFAYSFFYRIFENHSLIQNISTMWLQSNLISGQEIFSFQYVNFWKSVIFDQYRQYIHQMKAKIISNWYFIIKSTIWFIKFFENWIFQNFRFRFYKKNFFRTQIFQNFWKQPPKLLFSTCCKHQKW